jgi:sulfoacetaldehyde dehydrogenase
MRPQAKLRELQLSQEITAEIDAMVDAAKAAMNEIAGYNQDDIDQVVKAVAWAIFNDAHAQELAEIAVADTGLGKIADKITKNKRKTLGTLADLMAVKTVGVIDDDPALGITTYAKPVGVVGTLTPSTNPAATPANQAMMAIKSKNAIIICPSPAGLRTALRLQEFVYAEFAKIGAPKALFQIVAGPINFDKAGYLSKVADLILVTGDQKNVRNGYSSGTPCIGVGKGNVPVIIDSTADLRAAAEKVCLSKCFDNATSCSSENALIILDDVYDAFMGHLQDVGGYLCSDDQVQTVEDSLFTNGNVNREFVGQPLPHIFESCGFKWLDDNHKFIIVPQTDVGADHPLSGEKLSLILSVYRASDFGAATAKANAILNFEGIGHSVGIHTENTDHTTQLAAAIPVARVLVNQAHTFGNGGGFNNSLPFTLSMGCGTWAGNSISENLSYKDFFNVTKLVRTIDKPEPNPQELFEGFSA